MASHFEARSNFYRITNDKLFDNQVKDEELDFQWRYYKRHSLGRNEILCDEKIKVYDINEDFGSEKFSEKLFRTMLSETRRQLDPTKEIEINSCGESVMMTMDDIKDKILIEYGEDCEGIIEVPQKNLVNDMFEFGVSERELANTLKTKYEEETAKSKNKNVDQEMKRWKEYNWLNQRFSSRMEYRVQEAVKNALKIANRKGLLATGTDTYLHLNTLEQIGIKFSNLQDLTRDSDIGTSTHTDPHHKLHVETDFSGFIPCGDLYLAVFMEVKCPELKYPWLEDTASDSIKGSLIADAVLQLRRDVLRFLEIMPDVDISKIRIITAVALPTVINNGEFDNEGATVPILTKEYFDEGSEGKLADFLGIKSPSEDVNTEAVSAIHELVLARYLGAHSMIPLKTKAEAVTKEIKQLEQHIATRETALMESCYPDTECLNESKSTDLKKMIKKDMELIIKSFEDKRSKKQREKLKNNYPDVEAKFDDIHHDKGLIKDSNKKIVVYGDHLTLKMISAVDKGHQGTDNILSLLKPYVFLGKNMHDEVKNYVQKCAMCSKMQEIKDACVKTEKGFIEVPEHLRNAVIEIADEFHPGYDAVIKSIRAMGNFPNLSEKVRDYLSKCKQCGKRNAMGILSRSQRNAISSSSPLMMISGTYGTGKTNVAIAKAERAIISGKFDHVIICNYDVVREGKNLLDLYRSYLGKYEQSSGVKLSYFSRKELCDDLGINPAEFGNDNLGLTKEIFRKLSGKIFLVLDETPVFSNTTVGIFYYNWTPLPRPEISNEVVMCMQPILYKYGVHETDTIIELVPPVCAEKVELIQQFRSSAKIYDTVSTLMKTSDIPYLKHEKYMGHDTRGDKVICKQLQQDGDEYLAKVGKWLSDELASCNAQPQDVKIFYDMCTQKSREKLLRGMKQYEGCLESVENWLGCESLFVICLISRMSYSELLEITSRAKVKLVIISFQNIFAKLNEDLVRLIDEDLSGERNNIPRNVKPMSIPSSLPHLATGQGLPVYPSTDDLSTKLANTKNDKLEQIEGLTLTLSDLYNEEEIQILEQSNTENEKKVGEINTKINNCNEENNRKFTKDAAENTEDDRYDEEETRSRRDPHFKAVNKRRKLKSNFNITRNKIIFSLSAVGAVLFAIGLMAPPHYKEEVFNDVLRSVADSKNYYYA